MFFVLACKQNNNSELTDAEKQEVAALEKETTVNDSITAELEKLKVEIQESADKLDALLKELEN